MLLIVPNSPNASDISASDTVFGTWPNQSVELQTVRCLSRILGKHFLARSASRSALRKCEFSTGLAGGRDVGVCSLSSILTFRLGIGAVGDLDLDLRLRESLDICSVRLSPVCVSVCV